jgi:hypothetical protein
MAFFGRANYDSVGRLNGPVGDVTPNVGTFTNLNVTGDLTSINSTEVMIKDKFMYLGAENTVASGIPVGIVASYLPTATATTATIAGAFRSTATTTADPEITTVGSATFAEGDLIEIFGAIDAANNGLFEVQDHTLLVLKLRGTGGTALIEKFTQGTLVTSTVASTATITKVTVSILRAGADGIWETASGSSSLVAGLEGAFVDLASASVSSVTIVPTSGNTVNRIIRMNNTTQQIEESGVLIDGSDNLVMPSGSDIQMLGVGDNITFNAVDVFPVSSTVNGLTKWSSATGRAVESSANVIDASDNLVMAAAKQVIQSSELVDATLGNASPSGNSRTYQVTAATASRTGTMPDGTYDGQLANVVARSLGSQTYTLTITKAVFPGSSSGHTAEFDTDGQSLHMVWDATADAWFGVNAGAIMTPL